MAPGDSSVLCRALPAALRPTPAERREAKEFLARLSREICAGRGLVCLLTGDLEIRSLNRQFLNHDYATDVLSFPSGGPAGESLGEIAISLERAAAQALQFGHSRSDEIRILMLHGALHLVGHDHETDDGEMAREEARWRNEFGLPLSLIERTVSQNRTTRRTRQQSSEELRHSPAQVASPLRSAVPQRPARP